MKPFLFCLLFLSLLQPLLAQGPAGIVLYFQTNNDTYLLLADDVRKSKGWSAFGGAADKGETFHQTAVREAHEETRGYFSQKWLMSKIQNQRPFRDGGFTMFFVEVPFVPAQRVQNHPIPNKLNIAMYERPNYAWVPVSELKTAIQESSDKLPPLYLPRPIRADHYHVHWLASMKKALAQKACPWQTN